MKNKLKNNERYLLELLKNILHGEEIREKPENVSFEEVFKIAKAHDLVNMTYYGIKRLKKKPNKELLKIWKHEYMLSMLKENTQKQELLKIEREFEVKKIKSISLKGFEIKKLYPKSDMRGMSDLDILISKTDKEYVDKIMRKLNYIKQDYESEREIPYKKKPLMNVEIHTSLFGKDSKYYDYFKKLSNMEKIEKLGKYKYCFTSEDSFIYNFIHLVLHFTSRGIGIRYIIDQWLYLQKREDLDWEYIHKELIKLNVYDFYKNIIKLGKVWFEGINSEEKIELLGRYILNSGLYGNMDNYGVKKLSENGRIKSIFLLLFPNREFMEEKFPILKNKNYLLLPYYIVRWIKLLELQGISSIKKVVRSILFTKDRELKEREKFYKDIGLE